MKLNNKGFAITVTLYGLLILFVLLVGFYITGLSIKKNRVEEITDIIIDQIIEEENNIPPDGEDNNIETSGENLAEHIVNLFRDNKGAPVENVLDLDNNNIVFQYATNENLMNDRNKGRHIYFNVGEGNIRYYGKKPNNYILLGDDINNDMYRIIGVFKDTITSDGRKQDLVKVIKDTSIGEISWSSEVKKTDWNYSSLMNLLNPGYESNTYCNSLWWDNKKGNCTNAINHLDPILGEFDFIENGINNNYKNFIEKIRWPLGNSLGYGKLEMSFLDEAYGLDYLRSKQNYLDIENYYWDGLVSILKLSDYSYAADRKICKSPLTMYYDQDCIDNNWLYSKNKEWTFSRTPRQESILVISNENMGGISYDYPENAHNVRPSFYLKENTYIKRGNGTKNNPYIITIKDNPKPIVYEKTNLKDHIYSLYSNNNGYNKIYIRPQDPKDDGININGSFAYDTDLMSDEIKWFYQNSARYIGKYPNNYIYFNCKDYNNQTKDSCDMYRIIGAFDNRVKLIKDSPIENIAWDNNGGIDYKTSSVKNYLNNTFYNSLNDESRKLIVDSVWNLGHTLPGAYQTAKGFYLSEVNNNNGSIQPITAKIGLLYLSEFGFGNDLTEVCNHYTISEYNNMHCIDNNWLYIDRDEWVMNVFQTSSREKKVYSLGKRWTIKSPKTNTKLSIRPTFFLDENVSIKGGKGTKDKPYMLNIG